MKSLINGSNCTTLSPSPLLVANWQTKTGLKPNNVRSVNLTIWLNLSTFQFHIWQSGTICKRKTCLWGGVCPRQSRNANLDRNHDRFFPHQTWGSGRSWVLRSSTSCSWSGCARSSPRRCSTSRGGPSSATAPSTPSHSSRSSSSSSTRRVQSMDPIVF